MHPNLTRFQRLALHPPDRNEFSGIDHSPHVVSHVLQPDPRLRVGDMAGSEPENGDSTNVAGMSVGRRNEQDGRRFGDLHGRCGERQLTGPLRESLNARDGARSSHTAIDPGIFYPHLYRL